MSVEVKGLRFFAYHGLYAEEKKAGNDFEIELIVSFEPVSGTITGISDTVNYASLYRIIQSEMKKPRQLLETLAMELTNLIHETYPMIKRIEIAVYKLQVPVAKFTGKAGIRYIIEF